MLVQSINWYLDTLEQESASLVPVGIGGLTSVAGCGAVVLAGTAAGQDFAEKSDRVTTFYVMSLIGGIAPQNIKAMTF